MPSRLTVVVSLLLASAAVVFWLWLVIVPLGVIKLCPEECWCDVGGYVVDCSNKSLHNIPSIYLTHVQVLVFNDNNITSLENDSFISKGLTELNILAMDRCGLQTIGFGAFNGLTKLTDLSMRENGIGEITGRTFEEVSSLEYLGLDHNKIENLDVDVFSGLINLREINLTGNDLLNIHPDIFVGLPNLKSLVLRANEGLQIPTNHHFITSHSLLVLDISRCNVSSVSVETFANVRALKILDMSENSLSSVNINILKSLPKLSSISLYKNPLQCDCQLKEVWRWCQDHDIRTAFVETEPVRDTPSEGYIMWQCVLEELQCVQDNISNNVEYKQNRNKHLVDERLQRYLTYLNLMEQVLFPLLLFFSILGTIGNVITVIIITCNKNMRTVPNTYILNLAISDIICLTIEIILNSVVINCDFKGAFLIFCYRMSVGLPTYSIAVLSIQRYRVTVKPFRVLVSSQPTWCVAAATICGVWIVAALVSIPTAISKFFCFDRNMELRSVAYYKRVVLFEFFVFCVFPLLVIAFSYIMTARHLVNSSFPMSEETQNPQMNTRKNAAKIVVGLSFVFLISYVPYHVFITYFIFNFERFVNPLNRDSLIDWLSNLLFMLTIANCLLVINSCLNPVAIFCTSCLFREHLKRYLTCFYKQIPLPLINVEHTRSTSF